MRTNNNTHHTPLFLLLTILMALPPWLGGTAFAQTSRTWTGATSTAWNTASNWSPSGVPATIDHVAIPNTTNKPVLSGNVTIANFSITGGQLDLNGDTLTVNGTLSMTGGLVQDGLVKKTSTSAITITGVTVECELQLHGQVIGISGSRFKEQAHITKTGGANSVFGNNIWEAATWIRNEAPGNSITLGYPQPDTFLLDLHLSNPGRGFDLGSTGGSGAVVLAGSGLQQFSISAEGSVSGRTVTVNKPSGAVHLSGTLTIISLLNLTKGVVRCESGAQVTIINGATASGTSHLSHIEGPVLKKGNQAFTFPVGRNGHYRPISITAPASSTHSFKAEYFESDSDPVYSHASKDASLNYLSKNEYWTLTRVVGVSTPKVTLSWDTLTSCIMNTPLSAIHVASWNGSQWKDLGNGATTGNIHKGTVQTTNSVATFNAFILEHDDAMSLCGRKVDFDWTPTDTIWEGDIVTFNNLSQNYPAHFQYVWAVNDCWYLGICGDTLPYSTDFIHAFSVGNHKVTLMAVNNAGHVVGEVSKTLSALPADFLECNCEQDIACDFVGNGTFTGRFENPDEMHEAANLYCWIRDPDAEEYEGECVPLEFACDDVNGYEHQLIPDFCVGENSDSDFSVPNNMFTVGIPVYEPGESSADENSSYAVLRTWASYGLSTAFSHSYLVTKLMDGLNPNQVYKVSLDARLSNRSVRTSRINVGFTDGYLCPSTWSVFDNGYSISPSDLPGSQILSFTPNLTGGFLHGYTEWHHCETTFAANDDFTWMYIGGIYPYGEVEDPNGEYTQTHGTHYPFEYYHAGGFYPVNETRFFIDNVSISAVPPTITQGAGLCRTGSPITLNVTGSGTGSNIYTWSASPSDASLAGQENDMEIVVNPSAATTTYTVTVQGPNGCELTDQIIISSDYCCLPSSGSTTYINASMSGTQILTGAFAINGLMTIETGADIVFDGADVNMGPNASILVNAGASLTITDEAHLKACNNMWNGIYTLNGSAVTVNEGSLIEDAYYGLNIKSGTYYEVDNAIFNRNYFHIYLTPPFNAPVYPSTTITDSRFLCQTTASINLTTPVHANLLPPLASDMTYMGIFAQNIGNLKVGSSAQGNEFDNCTVGIYASGVANAYLIENSFTTHETVGIYVTNSGQSDGDIDIVDNTLLNMPFGIACYDNPEAEIKIEGNAIDFTGMVSPLSEMTAIFVDEITPSSPNKVSIVANTVNRAPNGIHVRNLEGAIDLVNSTGAVYIGDVNDISHEKVPNDAQAGILVQNCYETLIIDNRVTHPDDEENWWETGIRVSSGNNNWIFCNETRQIGNGFIFDNDMRPLTLFATNIMEDNHRGIMLNNGIIGPQGVSGTPYDNRWVSWGSEPNIEARGVGSDGNESPFIVRTGGGAYLPLNLTEIDGGEAVPTPTTTSGTWTAGCMFEAPNYKTEQDGNPEVENALSMLTVSEGELTARDSSMRWAGQYGLYKKLLVDEEMRYAHNDLTAFFNNSSTGSMGRLHRALKDFNVLRKGGSDLVSASTSDHMAMVNGLISESRVEQRLAEVLRILYSNISDLKTIGGNQEARLREIAQLCPIDEGFGVHIARSTLLKLDTLPRNYVSECERVFEPADYHWKDEPTITEDTGDGFAVYPNPSTGDITLRYGLGEGERGYIEVFNVLGATMYEMQLAQSAEEMKISMGLTSGIYVFRVNVNGQVRLTERLVIMRE